MANQKSIRPPVNMATPATASRTMVILSIVALRPTITIRPRT
jgi:hypothetical protein